MPYLRPILDESTQQAIARAMVAIQQQKLTPEIAYARWMEVWAVESLKRKLLTRVRMGQGAGERNQETLNEPQGGPNG
jgi:hypothetical protein